VKSRKINRERIEPGNEGKNIVTQDNCQEQNGTRIYRRGQKLGVYEAPRRRRLIDLTSRIPQPLTIYTNWVPPLQRIYISAERENKRGRTANHHCKKKIYHNRPVRFDIYAWLNPLSPELSVCQLLNDKDKRISPYIDYI